MKDYYLLRSQQIELNITNFCYILAHRDQLS